MNKLMLLFAAAGVLVWAGCFNFHAEVPEPPGFGEAPPSSDVRPADPNDKADVIRENQELRARNAWLERQIEGRRKKHHDLTRDQKSLQADIDRAKREQEQYR